MKNIILIINLAPEHLNTYQLTCSELEFENLCAVNGKLIGFDELSEKEEEVILNFFKEVTNHAPLEGSTYCKCTRPFKEDTVNGVFTIGQYI